jgi:hypothetical protein
VLGMLIGSAVAIVARRLGAGDQRAEQPA